MVTGEGHRGLDGTFGVARERYLDLAFMPDGLSCLAWRLGDLSIFSGEWRRTHGKRCFFFFVAQRHYYRAVPPMVPRRTEGDVSSSTRPSSGHDDPLVEEQALCHERARFDQDNPPRKSEQQR